MKLPSAVYVEEIVKRVKLRAKKSLSSLGVASLLDLLDPLLKIEGADGVLVEKLSSYDQVGPGGLTFAIDKKYLQKSLERKASVIIVNNELASEYSGPFIVCLEPRLAFTLLLEEYFADLVPKVPQGDFDNIYYKDRNSVEIGENVLIGPQSYIGSGVKIGANTIIYPQAYIEDGVIIGENCQIHPKVVLRWGVKIGSQVIIHAGAVIGKEGFGYNQIPNPNNGRLIHFKNTHIGGVTIEDLVEIGANTTIDRGLIEDTLIQEGTKIDNLVQIGHNCHLSYDSLIVAQSGLAGHSKVGERAFLLGQSGLAPGAKIGDDAIVGAQAGVSGTIPPGRKVWSGSPAREQREVYTLQAMSRKNLPLLSKFFKYLKESNTLEELKNKFFNKS